MRQQISSVSSHPFRPFRARRGPAGRRRPARAAADQGLGPPFLDGLPALVDQAAVPGDHAATAALFRSLGDPARVKIVNLLATSDEPVCICNLTGPLGLSQPTVSHHMKKLHDVGLVEREQRGKWAYFSLTDDALRTLTAVADLKGVAA